MDALASPEARCQVRGSSLSAGRCFPRIRFSAASRFRVNAAPGRLALQSRKPTPACFLLKRNHEDTRSIDRTMPTLRRVSDLHRVDHVYPVMEGPDVDPAPNVPTLEEIEIADELRHAIELRYLGKADPCRDTVFGQWRSGADEID
jgi:hypothetical protein